MWEKKENVSTIDSIYVVNSTLIIASVAVAVGVGYWPEWLKSVLGYHLLEELQLQLQLQHLCLKLRYSKSKSISHRYLKGLICQPNIKSGSK